MSGPRVSVVVITRNRRRELLHTLDRLAELPERPPVIVTDNGSTDGTAAAVAGRHPRVELLRPGRNLGAVGRNLAVRQVRTPYVAFCDDDSWWAAGALARAVRTLDDHPGVGLLAARTLVEPGGAEDPLDAALARSPLDGDGDGALPGPRVLGFLGCAAVARRTAFLDAGGYHPLLFLGAEETLLAYDLAARGWPSCYTPDVVAHHRPAAAPRPGRPALVRRNEVLTAWLRRPLPLALRRTRDLAADARRDPAARRALREALARVPAALRLREPLPPPVERAASLLEEPGP